MGAANKLILFLWLAAGMAAAIAASSAAKHFAARFSIGWGVVYLILGPIPPLLAAIAAILAPEGERCYQRGKSKRR